MKSQVVVDESDPVSIARHGEVVYIMDIGVDEFQRSGGTPRRAREEIGMHLTHREPQHFLGVKISGKMCGKTLCCILYFN